LQALLVIDNHKKYACKIVDFCSHGLLLKLVEKNANILISTPVRVEFSIDSDQLSKSYVINAQIKHVTPNGVGVLIDNMPLTVFDALKTQTPPEVGISELSAIEDSPRIILFKEHFRHCLLENVPGIVRCFFENLPDETKIINKQLVCFENSSELDDLITTLKIEGESLTSEFCHSIVDQIRFISENSTKFEDESSFDRSLSLVEKEEFEDWLNISSVIRKISNTYEDNINQLTRELSRIFGYSKSIINNPVNPGILCDCFRDLILQLGFNYKVNNMLYSCFGKALFQSLPEFYKHIEVFLSNQPSAEKIIPHYIRRSPESSNTIDHLQTSNFTDLKSEVQNEFLFKADKVDSKQIPAPQVLGKLISLLAKFDSGDLNKSSVNTVVPTIESANYADNYFDKSEILAAIAELQKNTDIQSVQGGMADRLQEKPHTLNSKAQLSNDSLQVHSKFFETLLNKNIISAELKSYIESIQLSLLALPLMGDNFLDSDSHPAKNILNKISYFDRFINNDKLVKSHNVNEFLQRITHKIACEALGDHEMLAGIDAELDIFKSQLVKSTDAKINHIVKAHEGQQKLEVARQIIQSEIDKRIAGKSISTVIPLLLEAGWQHLLVFAELNQDTQSAAKSHYLKVIDDLLFWLFEQDSILKIQASSIQTTITFIEEKLQTVGGPVQKRKQVVQELTELLIGVGYPKVRKPIQTIKISRQEPDEDIALIAGQDNYWDALIEQLNVGDWLNIKYGSDEYESMKIIWIGSLPKIYVLLSANALKNIEFDKNGLIKLFQNGSAEISENLDLPITERTSNLMLQDMHEMIKFNATHDHDTNLMLRDEFVKVLKNEVLKESGFQHMLCHIEILDFRVITNICGLEGGKQLLTTIVELITENIKDGDFLARLGDQSFAILYKECGAEQASDYSKSLLKKIGSTHFKWQEKSFPITLSMGLSDVTDTSFDINQVLQQADAASLSAEQSGPNQVLVFSGNNDTILYQTNLLEWIARIDTVFTEDRLFARCQKIVSLEKSAGHVHYEILLGIKDEDGNIIQPDFFIPAVERCKRMPEIDMWIINSVFDWIDNNIEHFNGIDGFSINLSGQSINSQDFLDYLQHKLTTCTFQIDKLVFEITETIASENLTFTKKFIKAIKEYGCKFSLDDFGSGYSSYAYLKNMDVDYLKIDGAFVKDIINNPADYAIVKSMNEIAHSLGLKTIAEYVENSEINEVIKEIGVDYGQGYFIHKPMPLLDLKIEASEKELFFFEDNSFWDI
jgi:diguanylate cyclase (GGDEF)-like protein